MRASTDEGMRQFVAHGGGAGVPVLVQEGQRVPGFSAASYDAIFKTAARR